MAAESPLVAPAAAGGGWGRGWPAGFGQPQAAGLPHLGATLEPVLAPRADAVLELFGPLRHVVLHQQVLG